MLQGSTQMVVSRRRQTAAGPLPVVQKRWQIPVVFTRSNREDVRTRERSLKSFLVQYRWISLLTFLTPPACAVTRPTRIPPTALNKTGIWKGFHRDQIIKETERGISRELVKAFASTSSSDVPYLTERLSDLSVKKSSDNVRTNGMG